MTEKRWRTGEGRDESRSMLFRDDACVGMVHSPELATEVAERLNRLAPNDREFIVKALGREANRIFNRQEKDYPSNVLDVVAANLQAGKNDELTVPPDWMRAAIRAEKTPQDPADALRLEDEGVIRLLRRHRAEAEAALAATMLGLPKCEHPDKCTHVSTKLARLQDKTTNDRLCDEHWAPVAATSEDDEDLPWAAAVRLHQRITGERP